MRTVFYILFASTTGWAFSGPTPALTCPNFLTGVPLFPVKVSPVREDVYFVPDKALFKVGEGTNGIVFELKPKSTPVERDYQGLLKVYKPDPNGSYEGSESRRDWDLLVLSKFPEMGTAEECGFDYAQGKPTQVKTVYTQPGKVGAPAIAFDPGTNPLGRTVASIAADESIPESIRHFVVSDYRRRLALLERCLNKRGFKQEKYRVDEFRRLGGAFDLPFLTMSIRIARDPYCNVYSDFLIKSDGVIIEPVSTRATVVDPS